MSRPERIAQTIAFATQTIPAELWAEIDALPRLPADDPETNRWK